MPEARPAGGAEAADHQAAFIRAARPALGLAAEELDVGRAHAEAHAEGGARLALAFIAVADGQPQRLAGEAITDFAALAAAFRGKDQAHVTLPSDRSSPAREAACAITRSISPRSSACS